MKKIFSMMKVKLLTPNAKAPTVANPAEDLGFDLFASEDAILLRNKVTRVSTGIAVQLADGFGGIIKDRSSMASKGITTSAGVIDAGYRGEVCVLLTYHTEDHAKPSVVIKRGDKIAQIVPVRVQTGSVEVVSELSDSARGEKGFGSSGV